MVSKPWVANGPEDRLSIAVDRFLRKSLVPPFWCSAIHDRDGGQRTMTQRVRDENRGIQKGQLDWDVIQGPPYLHRKLELKRDKNDLTAAQGDTVEALIRCGGPPIVAWDLLDVYSGMLSAGFRFLPNVTTTLQRHVELLAAWDREAELIKSGAVVKKRSARAAVAKPTGAKLRAVERIRSGGIRI